MRKLKAFSAKMSFDGTSTPSRTSFASQPRTAARVVPNGNLDVFMTPNLIKMEIREMKRPVASRFMTLVKSARMFVKSNSKPEDIMYLKRFVTLQLTQLLGSYVDMLGTNASLQLPQYLRINSVCPKASKSAKVLSRVMIIANRIRRSNGALPPKNQRDLNRAMDDFISDVIDSITDKSMVNVNDPLLNESLQD